MKYMIAAHSHPPPAICFPVFSQSDSIDGATWAEAFRISDSRKQRRVNLLVSYVIGMSAGSLCSTVHADRQIDKQTNNRPIALHGFRGGW